MKNGLKNAALVLLTLATVGLAGKVINDSTGFVDKLIGKKPDSANYLQVGDELLGKTLYLDSDTMVKDFLALCKSEGDIAFGELETDAVSSSASSSVSTFFGAHYQGRSDFCFKCEVKDGPANFTFTSTYWGKGIYKLTFPETISVSSSTSISGASLKIAAINQTIDLNSYVAYSEEALTEWKEYRKNHPFVKEEGSSETSSESDQTSDQGSETEVQEKARTATYAHEVEPGEDTDARFGAFC